MLIKLIKHDIKSSYRDLFPLYLGLLLFAVIAGVSAKPNSEWISIVTILPFFALFVATTVILSLTIIKLFTKRLYSNEGYLTFTLPVTTLQTFMSKIITASLWTLLTLIVYALASSLFAGIWLSLNWNFLQIEIKEFEHLISSIPWKTIIPDILYLSSISFPQAIVSFIYSSSLILTSVVFVNTSYVHNKKLAIGIVVYLILNFVFNNLLSNLTTDWLLFNENIGYQINWSMYVINFIYFTSVSVGLISLSIWLNDHKLELE